MPEVPDKARKASPAREQSSIRTKKKQQKMFFFGSDFPC
jgi:hypothetical protein